jgi:hypothetical protein
MSVAQQQSVFKVSFVEMFFLLLFYVQATLMFAFMLSAVYDKGAVPRFTALRQLAHTRVLRSFAVKTAGQWSNLVLLLMLTPRLLIGDRTRDNFSEPQS